MKNSVKILFLLFSAILYFVPISTRLHSVLNSGNTDPSSLPQEKQISAVSGPIYGLISQTEEISLIPDFSPTPKPPHTSGAGWIDLKIEEQNWSRVFANYSRFAINLPIHLRKSDLIFPFHYFW